MNHKNGMEPPWNVLGYPQTSLGWRMGGGEDYLYEWGEWFEHLSQEEQGVYIAQYPEPEDWFEFYHLQLEHSEEEIDAIIKRAQRLRETFCDLHYELALLHEEARHYGHAVAHLGNVIICITNYRIWDDLKIDETLEHYTILKRQMAQQMALNPSIQETWNTLRQFPNRTRIELQQTMVTAEDYTRMQQEVFYPSELGRTWIHCFEADTLYIHRHWQEPCLFLVILEPAEQGYRIAEAWMNLDPDIPRPLTCPPTEPGLFLTRLLSRFIKE